MKMKTTKLANTKENNAKVKVLKGISETKWVGGSNIQSKLDSALRGINLNSNNSGWYNPTGIKINGLTGIFMLNEDGSIFIENRIIKLSETEYRIEYLSNEGYNEFEKKFVELMSDVA